VIAVFTKFDQFRREVKIKLEDSDQHRDSDPPAGTDVDAEVETIFNEHFKAPLGESPLLVRLESEDSVDKLACTTLIAVPQECTSLANSVLTLLKRLPVHSLLMSLISCC
jgi:hypothetical protein